MITVVDLNQVKTAEPLISEVLFDRIQDTLQNKKKILLSLNRRGSMSTLVCRDCGWAARCPACDLMMRVHARPEDFLLCHFCEAKKSIPAQCPKCQSYHLVQSGARVQSIDVSIRKLFPKNKVLLVEDLSKITPKSLADYEIFIGTQKITTLPIENLGLVGFLLVESDLSVPEYDIEEDTYGQIRHFLSRAEQVILQTRSPKLPLIQDLTQGNFRQFFQRTTSERKTFHLPPFSEMVVVRVADNSESITKDRIASLASGMIEQAKDSKTTVVYDHLLVERRAGKYAQKILIRSPELMTFLEPFRKQLVRGRGIEVEWL